MQAQGWTFLPNNSWGYTTTYVTSGMFSCGNYLRPGACQTFGNSIILTSGSSVLTMSFQGVQSTVTALMSGPTSIGLGSFTQTWSGPGPHVLPTSLAAPYVPIFNFGMSFSLTWPTLQTANAVMFFSNPNNSLDAFSSEFSNVFQLGTSPPPPQLHGVGFAFGDMTEPDAAAVDGVTTMSATVSINPEPSTIALLATGLAGVFGIARRRVRKS